MTSPGRPWLALIQSIELLSSTFGTMDTLSNLAGERGGLNEAMATSSLFLPRL